MTALLTVLCPSLAGADGHRAALTQAPPDMPDAVADDVGTAGHQGLVFVNRPAVFDDPGTADLPAFALRRHTGGLRPREVHGQIPPCAWTPVCPHRTTAQQEPSRQAWDAVRQPWTPEGAWHTLATPALARHRTDFNPL